MDWRDYVVFEKMIEDKYWNDIIKLRSKDERGFYNINFLKKEDEYMQAYLDFLSTLQDEYVKLEATDVKALVDARVAEFRIQATDEENKKLATAKANKQAEIDAMNRIIERKRKEAEESAVADTCEIVETIEEV